MTQYFTKNDDDTYAEVKDFTKEQIDEIAGDTKWLTSRLDDAKERVRKEFSDYDDLKSAKADFETKLKESTDKITDLESKVKTATLETDRVKIVHEFKLNDELAEFVTGDTVDDMRKRAEKLSKGMPTGSVNIEKTGKPDSKTDTVEKQFARNLFGHKSDD